MFQFFFSGFHSRSCPAPKYVFLSPNKPQYQRTTEKTQQLNKRGTKRNATDLLSTTDIQNDDTTNPHCSKRV